MKGDLLHSLCRLSRNTDEFCHVETVLQYMEMFEQTRSLTPLSDDGQTRFGDAAHEQQNVQMARFSVAHTHTQTHT